MSIAPYLPGKRLIFTVVPVLIVIGILSFLISSRDKAPVNEITVSTPSKHTFNETDSDSDGLRDWEEALWGTNRGEPDTDGDGTGDAEEITLGRSPSTKGPNDKLPSADLITSAFASTSATTYQNLTKTDALARILFGQAVILEQGGSGLTPDALAQISGLFGQTGQTQTVTARAFTSADLSIVETTNNTLRTYGNQLGTILIGTPTEETNELLIFAQFAQTQDQSVLSKLSTVARSYEAIADELTLIAVPEGIASTHLAFLNAFSQTGGAIEKLAVLATDPLAAIVTLQPYADYSEQMTAAFSDIKKYLNNSNVTFAPNEPGYKIVTDNNES